MIFYVNQQGEPETIDPPVADDNFVVIPIFNPSTNGASFCSPLWTNWFILLCEDKKN